MGYELMHGERRRSHPTRFPEEIRQEPSPVGEDVREENAGCILSASSAAWLLPDFVQHDLVFAAALGPHVAGQLQRPDKAFDVVRAD
jgi:hypothetical protein